jgi:hypothetical protein
MVQVLLAYIVAHFPVRRSLLVWYGGAGGVGSLGEPFAPDKGAVRILMSPLDIASYSMRRYSRSRHSYRQVEVWGHRVKRFLGKFVLVPLVALMGFFIVAPTPAFAVGCSGDYCSGQDPLSTGCSADAYTVHTASVYGTYGARTVEIRWSPTCKTNWARVNWVTTNVKAVQQTGYTQGYSSNNGTVAWSKMIYSPTLCVKGVIWGSWGTTETACV